MKYYYLPHCNRTHIIKDNRPFCRCTKTILSTAEFLDNPNDKIICASCILSFYRLARNQLRAYEKKREQQNAIAAESWSAEANTKRRQNEFRAFQAVTRCRTLVKGTPCKKFGECLEVFLIKNKIGCPNQIN